MTCKKDGFLLMPLMALHVNFKLRVTDFNMSPYGEILKMIFSTRRYKFSYILAWSFHDVGTL